MPLFHFHIVVGDEREHVGSLDLPSCGEALPVGIRLTMRVLGDLASACEAGDGVTLQATDVAGAVVCTFDVSQGSGADGLPIGPLH